MRLMLLVSLFFSAFAFARETSPSKAVAVFWVGEEQPDQRVKFDIADVARAYQEKGYRVLRFDGQSPTELRRLIIADRIKNRRDYLGATITLVIHGQPKDRSADPAVVASEIIYSFLDGIGPEAVGEVVAGSCFAGVNCREVDLTGSPFSGHLKRLMAVEESRQAFSPEDIRRARRARFLSDLLDVVMQAPELAKYHDVGIPALSSLRGGERNPESSASATTAFLLPVQAVLSDVRIEFPSRLRPDIMDAFQAPAESYKK